LHFQTCTTIDTLDYSGGSLNEGSKVVIAAAGPRRRELAKSLPAAFRLPDGFSNPRVVLPGIVAVQGADYQEKRPRDIEHLVATLAREFANGIALIVVTDDSEFAAATLNNFLWVTFTRSNPAADVAGVGEFTKDKHWGCEGPLIIDARIKPHHAPPLEDDPGVTKRVDALGAPGGPLHGII
jgi:4-hydroxy-3-polyprenylbenzoate decarboxylase